MPTGSAQAEIASDHVLFVGRDAAGHWVVRENHGLIEGLFVSHEAALRFARSERHALHARVEEVAAPLSSILSA